VSFWRKQLLELGVGLATLPIAGVVWALVFGALYQSVDFKKNAIVFYAAAFSVLTGWILLDRWVIRRIERRRGSKAQNVH